MCASYLAMTASTTRGLDERPLCQRMVSLPEPFLPHTKTVGKQRVNSKYRKKYDAPQTPYHRVLASNQVSDESKEGLKTLHQSLNPFILKRIIEKKLRVIFQYVKVTSNVRQRI
jgi:hypothetical protein